MNRFAPAVFDERNIVPLGYAAFAFAVGMTAGLLLRRTVPAMAVTLAVFVGVQLFMPSVVRANLLPSTTVDFRIDKSSANAFTGVFTTGGGNEIHFSLPVPHGAWVISAPPVEDSANRVVHAYTHLKCLFPSPSGAPSKGGGPSAGQAAGCLARYDLHQSVTYQPASHYWPLQWYETGIFLALAAALSGSCFWTIRRRQN